MLNNNCRRLKTIFVLSSLLLVTILIIPLVVSQKDYEVTALRAHNAYRRRHKNTPPMKLDSELNTKAQKCAEFYAAANTPHSCPEAEEYGENIARGGLGANEVAAVKKSVEAWYDGEKNNYDFNKPGPQPGTGHFTQVIWVTSVRLGCGVAKKGNDYYVPCLYTPDGNGGGKEGYQKNVQRLK